ncbi:MAG: hypothetical protein ABR598_03110 [Candidatus Dormibacteria bacterium]
MTTDLLPARAVNMPAGHAEVMMSSMTTLLGARRLLAHRIAARSRTRGLDGAAEAAVKHLENERRRWALQCAPDNPELWIAAYSHLLRRVEDLIVSMTDALPAAGPQERAQLTQVELPELRAELEEYRRRLRRWQARF